MEHVHLGRLGLKVSPLCLGTMNFGWDVPGTDEDEAFRIMDRALEHGINFFDTANVYGWRQGGGRGEGITEQILGRWFAEGGGRRERVVLATKVYGEMGSWPNESRLSALNIRRACDASLRRLRTDYIDLYQFHHVDREAPWDEIWQAIEQLVQAGKILYAGSSNFAGWHIAQANEAAARMHFLGLVSEQCKYNLTVRSVELEVLPACERYGLGVIPYSPLAGGILGGALQKASAGRRASKQATNEIERRRSQLESYEKLCADMGAEPANVALAWLLSNPVVTAPIIGPRSVGQLDDATGALDVSMTPDILAGLDEIFPGPGGPGPEAWAW
jgi:NDP-hexose C3-ketoreductase / dTDP-4-oxo-2-deoxy-alpha-D-pentos-2-ene 2,3-reductase